MAEKVKVSREVADGIEYALKQGTKENLLVYHASNFLKNDGKVWTAKEYLGLNQLTPEQLAIALYVGYETVQTPGEYLLHVYKNHLERPSCQPAWNDGFADGVKRTLEILGIPIKGIND